MQLDGIVVVARGPVDRRRPWRAAAAKSRLGVPDLELERLAHELARLGALRPWPWRRTSCRLRHRNVTRISDCGVVRLLLRLGEHHGDRLAVPVDPVVLHDRQIVAAGRLGGWS